MSIEDILRKLLLGKYYYCEAGPHEGEWHIELDGYITGNELRKLQEFIN